MKVLTLALLLSLPVPWWVPPAQPSLRPVAPQAPHAVYCYGPIMTMPKADGELIRVATFCRGDKTMVPLKD